MQVQFEQTPTDSATMIFSEAENALLDDDIDKALRLYNSIVSKYENSPITPRALYAVAWLYEYRYLDKDKAIAAYETLNNKYSDSSVGKALAEKLNEVKKHLEARKREERLEQLRRKLENDRLSALENVMRDSIKIEYAIELLENNQTHFLISVLTDSTVTKAATRILDVDPILPDSLLRLNVRGIVDVKLLINAVGIPIELTVFRNNTIAPSLGNVVLVAARNSKYSPAIDNQNRPVEAWHVARYIFPIAKN